MLTWICQLGLLHLEATPNRARSPQGFLARCWPVPLAGGRTVSTALL